MQGKTMKTILVCRYNDVTLIDVKLHGKGSTVCEILMALHAALSPALAQKFLCL